MDSRFVTEIGLAIVLVLAAVLPLAVPALTGPSRELSRYRVVWRDLAERAGFEFENGRGAFGARVSGCFRGRPFTFSLRAPRQWVSGVRTSIRMDLARPLAGDLVVQTKPLPLRLARAVVGSGRPGPHPELAQRFSLRSQPDKLAERLAGSSNLRYKLLHAPPVRLEMDGHYLWLLAPGIVSADDDLFFLLGLANDAARLMDGASQP